ncbi:hypothetical protein DdX_17000 [Ditylenchus destructor]|uniref:Uncharacterized protein n=1 Tax=Ditylenchus destructor TaxID=166010 RepID=A0AAD4MSM1_9BILA|nr:hypothetical protein DdX_17000 [Ditylenchus destructor]
MIDCVCACIGLASKIRHRILGSEYMGPGQLPPATAATPKEKRLLPPQGKNDNCHPDNCHPRQLPPQRKKDNCHLDNCHPRQLPPATAATPKEKRLLPPRQLPPATAATPKEKRQLPPATTPTPTKLRNTLQMNIKNDTLTHKVLEKDNMEVALR